MTNEEFDRQIDATERTLDGLPGDFDFQKFLLKAALENLREVHDAPAGDELGLGVVARRLQKLNRTIEAGLDKVNRIKKRSGIRRREED